MAGLNYFLAVLDTRMTRLLPSRLLLINLPPLFLSHFYSVSLSFIPYLEGYSASNSQTPLLLNN